MSWLSPYRWILIAAALAALVFGYFAWSDRIGDIREAKVLAKIEILRAAENDKNAQITADLQKRKDDALLKANTRALANKAAADRLAAVNRGLRDELANQRNNLSTASDDAVRKYATTSSELLAQCGAALADMARQADSHSSDVKLLQDAWPK